MAITSFNEYQREAMKFKFSLNKFNTLHPNLSEDVKLLLAVAYDGLGLGEAGEVQGKIKKIIRDNGGIITDEAKMDIMKELGDTLFYIASMCDDLDVTLCDVADLNLKKINDRKQRNVLEGSGDNR